MTDLQASHQEVSTSSTPAEAGLAQGFAIVKTKLYHVPKAVWFVVVSGEVTPRVSLLEIILSTLNLTRVSVTVTTVNTQP